MSDRIKQILEAELGSPEFAVFYEYLKFNYPELQNYPTYSKLISFLHNRDSKDYFTKDNIFKLLIREYQQSYDRNLSSFFTYIFYPGTINIFLIYIKEYPIEDDELLGIIRVSLFDQIAKYDIVSKPSKVASKIIGGVRNKVRKEINIFLEDFNSVDINTVDVADNKPVDLAPLLLQNLVRKNVITEEEKEIISQTRIEGTKGKDLAIHLNISYENLRSIKKRAEEKIRIISKRKKKTKKIK